MIGACELRLKRAQSSSFRGGWPEGLHRRRLLAAIAPKFAEPKKSFYSGAYDVRCCNLLAGQ
jgi:hypothetical protein